MRTRPPASLALSRVAAVAAGLLLGGGANAASQTLTLDPTASHIGFTLGAVIHTVEGRISLGSGTIHFDADTGAASGEIVVDARSATTDLERRDRNMHDDVLGSATFPRIVFHPDHLAVLRREGNERAEIQLAGRLAMHGHELPLTLPATLMAQGDRLEIESRFPVHYVDWGMPAYSVLFVTVEPSVDVTVEAEGRLATP
jgi:polyisoprenoid-binding protein YceI